MITDTRKWTNFKHKASNPFEKETILFMEDIVKILEKQQNIIKNQQKVIDTLLESVNTLCDAYLGLSDDEIDDLLSGEDNDVTDTENAGSNIDGSEVVLGS